MQETAGGEGRSGLGCDCGRIFRSP